MNQSVLSDDDDGLVSFVRRQREMFSPSGFLTSTWSSRFGLS